MKLINCLCDLRILLDNLIVLSNRMKYEINKEGS